MIVIDTVTGVVDPDLITDDERSLQGIDGDPIEVARPLGQRQKDVTSCGSMLVPSVEAPATARPTAPRLMNSRRFTSWIDIREDIVSRSLRSID